MTLRVLHVLNSASGGSALSTLELIKSLAERDVVSSLVCFDNATPEQKKGIEKQLEGRVIFVPLYWINKRIRAALWKRPLIEIKSGWETWFGYRHLAEIVRFISDQNIQVVHTSTIVNREGALAAMKKKLPHVWHVRELIGPGEDYRLANYPAWAKFVETHSDVVVANSPATADRLLHFLSAAKVTIVENGIELNNFTIKDHGGRRQKIVIGMVGNVTSGLKNHAMLLEIAALLKDEAGLEFRIYGSLPSVRNNYYSSLLELARKLNLGEHLKFMGFNAHPGQIMQDIDILFHANSRESFGRIFIEAMAGGIPIVAVRGGGADELIQQDANGYLVGADDVEGAAAKLMALVASSDLRGRLGTTGRQIAEDRYDLGRCADRVHALYMRLIEEFEQSKVRS